MEKIEHKVFRDERGVFAPIPIMGNWDQCSIATNDNPFTFRGLHYQTNPPQRKYIKIIQGSIIDFSVDIETLDTEYAFVNDSSAVEIPVGRAHGYLTLEPNTIVAYLVEGEYNPESEHSIVWSNCPKVKEIIESTMNGIELTISKKDKEGK